MQGQCSQAVCTVEAGAVCVRTLPVITSKLPLPFADVRSLAVNTERERVISCCVVGCCWVG